MKRFIKDFKIMLRIRKKYGSLGLYAFKSEKARQVAGKALHQAHIGQEGRQKARKLRRKVSEINQLLAE